jgi:hydroxymethylbilane synthase
VPIAAHATVADGRLHLTGLVAGLDGAQLIRDELEDDAAYPARAGEALAACLRAQGADRLLVGLIS